MLTLAEFRATGKQMGLTEGAEAVEVETDFFSVETLAIWVYDDRLWIEQRLDDEFGVLILRDYWIGTKAEMEARLYFTFYADEQIDGVGEAGLTRLLEEYCEHYGLACASADDMLAELPDWNDTDRFALSQTNRHRLFLSWFIETWERAQAVADDALGKRF